MSHELPHGSTSSRGSIRVSFFPSLVFMPTKIDLRWSKIKWHANIKRVSTTKAIKYKLEIRDSTGNCKTEVTRSRWG